jgi:integrase
VKAVLEAEQPVATDDGFVPDVFVSRLGRAFSVRWLSNAFAAAEKRANVEGRSFHSLRHTAVSRMVAAGIPDRIILKTMGHTMAAMGSRYARLAPDSLKGATDCLAGGNRAPILQAAGRK